MIKIIYDYEPTGQCPVQAEGTINGNNFYFRARGECFVLYLAVGNQDPLKEGDVFHEKYIGEIYQYWIKKGEQDPQMTAGWATKRECKAFIKKAAKKLLSEKV